MQQTIDLKRFGYIGRNGQGGHCWLRVYQKPGRAPVVIATEIAENRGPSVTNSWEQIAALVWQLLERPAAGMVFIEHYTGDSYAGQERVEKFELVTFTYAERFEHPTWKHMDRLELEAMLDGAPV